MKKQFSPRNVFVAVLFVFISQPIFSQKEDSRKGYLLTVDTWVYLESAMIDPGGTGAYTLPMRNSLNSLKLLPGQSYQDIFSGVVYTPAGQNYNEIPWYYAGTEGLGYDSYGNPVAGYANYPSTIVDWVLVSLRDSADGESLCQKAGLLHSDGYVEFTDGGFTCNILNHYESLYVVIEHSNHLLVMSPQPVPITNYTLTYDFRYSQSYIDDPFGYGGYGQKEILEGVFAMYAGNNDQSLTPTSDTDINFDDMINWIGANGTAGLNNNSDINLNGDCNFNDRITWEVNNGIFSTVPRN
jgi:hypothetical protein